MVQNVVSLGNVSCALEKNRFSAVAKWAAG